MTDTNKPLVRSHRDLIVWQKAIDLAVETYRVSRLLPREERFGLTSQMQRASVSIAANIAEGHRREGTLDFIRFLGTSRGSGAELDTYCEIVQRVGYVPYEELSLMYSLESEVDRMTVAIQRSLRRKVRPRSSRVDRQ